VRWVIEKEIWRNSTSKMILWHKPSITYKEYIMDELIAKLEEDIDLLVYDNQPTDIEKKIASDLVEVIIYLKKKV
jgi:hypothetical protein